MALQYYLDKNAPTIIIALNREESYRQEINRMLGGCFIPHKAVIWKKMGDERLETLIPSLENYTPYEDKTSVYICKQRGCEEPLTDLTQIWEAFERL
jgi:uncharacterized protein YyaL (SSP411 family)